MAATIEGAFVLIDRASSTMEKMERQAKKTMAAIEGVGAAQDLQSSRGQKAAQALEGQNSAMKESETRATRAEKALRDMGQESQRTSQRVKQLEQALSKMRAELQRLEQQQKRTQSAGGGGGLGGIKGFKKDLDDVSKGIGSFIGSFGVLGQALMMFKLPALGSGVAALVQGVGAMGGAVVAFLPDLTALASGMLAIPAAVGVAVQGFGAFMAAMQGVSAAVSAGMQATAQWSVNQRQYAQQVVQAQQGVTDAVHGVGDAMFAQGQAVIGLNQAYYQHQQSLRNLSDAVYNQTQAQINLTIARRDAIRTLADMEFAAKNAVLQEARAGLNIRQAQQQLQQAMMTPGTTQLQLESDRLAVLEAQSAAQQTQTQAARQRVDYARAARGDPTSAPTQQVVQAQHGLQTATYGVADAQHSVAESTNQITVAQHSLADASFGVTRAQQGLVAAQFQLNTLLQQGNAGTSGFRKALLGMGPAAKQFVEMLFGGGTTGLAKKGSFIDQIQQMEAAAGAGLFPKLTKGITTLLGAFPMIDRHMQTTGGIMGDLANNVIKAFFGPKSLGGTSKIMSSNEGVLRKVADAAGHFAGIIHSLMLAAGPLLNWLARVIDHWLKLRDAFYSSGKGQDDLHKKFDRFKAVLTGLFDVLKNLWAIVQNVSKAATPLTNVLNQGAITGTGRLAKLTGTPEEQAKMRTWFMGLLPVLRALGSLAKDFGRAFGILTAPGANKVGAGIISGLGALLPTLAKALVAIEGIFGPTIINTFKALAPIIGSLAANSGPFAVWLRILNGIVTAFNFILKIPLVGKGLATAFAAIFAVKMLADYGRKLFGVVTAVTRIRDRWRQAGAAQKGAMGQASPGTGGGIFRRAFGALTGRGGVAGAAASESWGIKSLAGPGSVVNPLMVRVEGGRIGGGFPGGGTSTGGKLGKLEAATKEGETVVGDASKVSKIGRAGELLAAVPGGGLLRKGLSKLPGLGGLAGEAGIAAEGAGFASKLAPVMGVLGKVAGPLGIALTALPAVLSFFSTKGSFGTKAGAAASSLVSTATFGLVNPSFNFGAPSAAAQARKGQGYANRDFATAAALGTNPLTGTLSAAGLARLRSSAGSLQSQITAIQHPAATMTRFGAQAGVVDKAKLEARRAELAAVNAAIARDQIQAGTVAAQNWGNAFQQGISSGKKPGVAMKGLIGGLTTQLATLNPQGKRSLLLSMESWGQQIVQSNPKMKGPVDDLNKYIIGSFQGMGQQVSIVNGQILTGSQTEWTNISTALTNPIQVAQEKLSGSFGAIQKMAIGSLTAMGFPKSEAQMLLKKITAGGQASDIASNTIKTKGGATGGGTVFTSTGTAINIPGSAGGGRIAGNNLRDVYHYGGGMLGGGELVMNRHHEQEANSRLMRHGEPTVGSIVANRNTPHWHGAIQGRNFATGGYVDPLPGFTIGRTDMGVDANAPVGTPILAMGPSKMTALVPGWYNGQPLMDFQLTGGPDAGRFWYVAEQIVPKMHVGDSTAAGGTVATYAPSGTGIEIGWAANASGQTLAQATTGYKEGQITPAGKSFLSIIKGGQVVAPGAVGGRQIPTLKAPNLGIGGVPGLLAQASSNAYAAGLTQTVNANLAQMGGGAGYPGGLPATGGGNATANQALALQMLPAFGWGADQMPPLIRLWNQESGWSQTALNKSSGAFGIPQSLPANKMASAGSDWQTNPATQMKWGMGYIKGRYGNPAGAWAHEVSNNWYAGGGRMNWGGWNATGGAFVTQGPTLFGAGEGGRSERVTVSPADSPTKPINITIHKIEVHRKGDIQKIVDEELALLADSLRSR